MESFCVRAFAEALEVVPYTLSENAGLNPINIVTELRRLHAAGEKYAGINVKKVGGDFTGVSIGEGGGRGKVLGSGASERLATEVGEGYAGTIVDLGRRLGRRKAVLGLGKMSMNGVEAPA